MKTPNVKAPGVGIRIALHSEQPSIGGIAAAVGLENTPPIHRLPFRITVGPGPASDPATKVAP